MNLKRYMFIVLILLVCMVSISAVCAEDDTTDDIISADDEEIILDEAIDEDVSSANDNYDDELILEGSADESKLSETSPGTFADLNNDINGNSDSTIYLTRNYTYAGEGDHSAVRIERPVVIYGNGITIKGANSDRTFYIRDGVTLIDINFVNSVNGTICIIPYSSNVNINNCTFIQNHVETQGGAIYVGVDCTNINFNNCTFIENDANVGGAIFVAGAASVNAINCTFINNSANLGGAMWGGSAALCRFVEDSDKTYNTNIITPAFSVSDLTTTYNSGDKLLFNLTEDNTNYDGFNTTIKIYQNEQLVGTYYALTGDDNGWVVDLSAGTYKAVLSLDSHPEVEPATVTMTIDKSATEISSTHVSTTYNVAKDLVITLKDADGNPISGATVTVDLNGAKKYTTDKNGQVKVAVGKLVPKTYTAKISFAGDDNYNASSTTAKVTVKKASPKITASAKSFKFEDKTKKYTVTLKDNKGNVLKNKKVTLKVNGKTYTATTNSKGVATFKLTKLTKKGTFTAVVTFAGDKYYSKVTKKPKITVKAPAWKTVSKGSKEKAMVKKIQKALKKNGYYLSYKGRYLKVDGKFHKYTEMAVKQFQKAKGLKVTGKVDYVTAKKLKLVS